MLFCPLAPYLPVCFSSTSLVFPQSQIHLIYPHLISNPCPISNTFNQACKGIHTPKINTGFSPVPLDCSPPRCYDDVERLHLGFFPLPAHCYVLAFFIFVSYTPSRPRPQTPPARTILPSGASLPGFSTARTADLPPGGLYTGI